MYIPDAGDLVWLDFDPQAGHKQAKRRPAVVLSAKEYNRLPFSLMLCCPATIKIKGYPWEVVLSGGERETVVLSDQVKCLDWKVRQADFIRKITADELAEIRGRAVAIISPD